MSYWLGKIRKYTREITITGLVLLALSVVLQWQANENLRKKLESKDHLSIKITKTADSIQQLPKLKSDINAPLSVSELRSMMNRMGVTIEQLEVIHNDRLRMIIKELSTEKLPVLLKKLQGSLIALDSLNIQNLSNGKLHTEFILHRYERN